MKIDIGKCYIKKDGGPVYYWLGNPYVFLSKQAGEDILIQKVFSDLRFDRFLLDTSNKITEYTSGSHEYLIQHVDPEWRTMRALCDRGYPFLLKSAQLHDIDIGIVHLHGMEDKKSVGNIKADYYSLKGLI